MIFSNSVRIIGASMVAIVIATAPYFAAAANAQERHERRGPERERYHTPHWVLDDRYHHNHYYPSVGYRVTVLPPGYLAVGFHGNRYFFNLGVWFRPVGPGYVVVRPPVGVVLPVLPAEYTTVWVGGAPYYYANDIYYTATPGGYAVAAPPMEVTTTAPVQSAPPVAPPPQASATPGAPNQSAAGMWYYCESAKAYYPYVPACKEGWRPVPATPPPAQ